jgi:hypothetical protein
MSAGKVALVVGGVGVLAFLAYRAFSTSVVATPSAVAPPVGAGGTLFATGTTAAAPVGSPSSGVTLKSGGIFVAKVAAITAAAPVLGSIALVKGVGSAAKSTYNAISNFL